MRDDAGAAHSRLTSATETMVAYRGSDAYKAFVEVLDALAEGYKLDLIEVSAADLPRVQAALKQSLALRNCLLADQLELPKI